MPDNIENHPSEVPEKDEQEQELFEHYRFEVEKGQRALRIDKYLNSRIQNTSRTKIQAAAQAGSILVNNKVIKSNYKVSPGDVVSIVLEYPPRQIEVIPEDLPLSVMYEDDNVLIINKMPGMVVHPGYGNYTGTLVNALAWRFKDLPLFNADDPRPGLVHRLDKNTSGVMVIAKTELAKMHLARQFFDRTTSRRYHAVVWGSPKSDTGTITGHIGRNLRNRKIMDIFPDSEYGKHAVTHYKVIERFGYVSLIECRLETGRTHQIRAHTKHIGHPVFNDSEYGGDQILKGTTFTKYKQFIQNCFAVCPRQALHAKTLAFDHPTTGERMAFDSSLPDDMAALVEKWRNYAVHRLENS